MDISTLHGESAVLPRAISRARAHASAPTARPLRRRTAGPWAGAAQRTARRARAPPPLPLRRVAGAYGHACGHLRAATRASETALARSAAPMPGGRLRTIDPSKEELRALERDPRPLVRGRRGGSALPRDESRGCGCGKGRARGAVPAQRGVRPSRGKVRGHLFRHHGKRDWVALLAHDGHLHHFKRRAWEVMKAISARQTAAENSKIGMLTPPRRGGFAQLGVRSERQHSRAPNG